MFTIMLVLHLFSNRADACTGNACTATPSAAAVEWDDETKPSIVITANYSSVSIALIDVTAICGQDTLQWTTRSVHVASRERTVVSLYDIDQLRNLRWKTYGVQLVVRVSLIDANGRAIDFASPPNRFVWFSDDEQWQLLSDDEALLALGGVAEDGQEPDAVLPGDAVYRKED
ncbi:MAG: hypothetical protein R3F59_25570 [Myxococcota bacterium]